MKRATGSVIFCVFLVLAPAVRGTVLPGACGNQNTIIDVATHKGGPGPTAPEAGKARVVFIEMADKNAMPVTTRVALDGAWVGANKGNSYFASDIVPGEHHVCTDWQMARRWIKDSPAFDVFTAEAGKTYYFEVTVTWTVDYPDTGEGGKMGLELSPVNVDEGKYLILNSKFSTSTQK